MPPQEVFFRTREAFRKKVDKTKLSNLKDFNISCNCKLEYEKLKKISGRFKEKKLKKFYPLKVENIIKEADNVMENRFNVFGKRIKFSGSMPDWHRAPKTGKRWPVDLLFSDVNIREGEKYGGPKFVWEINRFYFMPSLAMAYRFTGNESYANKIFTLLKNWIKKNPFGYGVNWSSCIELSLRLINLLFAVSLLDNYEIRNKDKEFLNKFVKEHCFHIYRYPSKHSSANNHALAESLALFLGGLLCEGKDASKWFKRGKKIFENEVPRQFLDDGGSSEMTTTYLSFTADMLLFYKLICDVFKVPYSSFVNVKLEKISEFIKNITDSKGNFPNIGDQDDAVLINLGLTNKENWSSLPKTIDALLGGRVEADFKTLLLIGETTSTEKSGGDSFDVGMKKFENSGLVSFRSGNEKEVLWCMNASPMGFAPLYAHGHLDALSFWLSVKGKEIFIDTGTYLYHSGGKWRKYFRSAVSHNTIIAGAEDFSIQSGDFMYGKPYDVEIVSTLEEEDGFSCKMKLGYSEYFIKRKFKYFVEDGSFTIIDKPNSTKGERIIPVRQFFHLHPECGLSEKNSGYSIRRGNVEVLLNPDKKTNSKMHYGSKEPLAGWYSPGFNILEKTVSIITESDIKQGGEIMTEGKIL